MMPSLSEIESKVMATCGRAHDVSRRVWFLEEHDLNRVLRERDFIKRCDDMDERVQHLERVEHFLASQSEMCDQTWKSLYSCVQRLSHHLAFTWSQLQRFVGRVVSILSFPSVPVFGFTPLLP